MPDPVQDSTRGAVRFIAGILQVLYSTDKASTAYRDVSEELLCQLFFDLVDFSERQF